MMQQQNNNSSQPWTSHLDLFGNPECDYHAQVTIGSTLMNLVLDTGSSNTAVISDLCTTNCSFVEKPYLPIPVINNLNSVNASYGNTILHSSWKGFATGQLVTFEGVKQTFARIDLITENQSFFIPRCSKNQGIWGLAHPSLQTRPLKKEDNSTFAQQQKLTLFDAIRREKGVPNAFTYQICPKSAVDTTFASEFKFLSQSINIRNNTIANNSTQASPAPPAKTCLREGHFWLGGYPSNSVGSEIVWVPLSHTRYYEVKIESFLVNNEIVSGMEHLNTPRTIIDTGTKDIVMTPQNLQRLLNALWHSKLVQFDSTVSIEHERAFWFDHAQLTIPRNSVTISHNTSVQIAFEGDRRVSIPIENILSIKPYEELQDWINISWTGLSNGGGGRMASTILGNTLMRGKTVIFDRGREEDASKIRARIGFADASACCRPSSGKDVDILLSVDSVSKTATQSQDHRANTVQILLILLIVLSGIGFFSTLAVFIMNYRHEKSKRMKDQADIDNGVGIDTVMDNKK